MAAGGRRGPKPQTARDWLFGSRPRRLLLAFVLNARAPSDGWTKTELASRCDVSKYGGISSQVDGLVALGLLEVAGKGYRPGKEHARLRRHLRLLVRELEDVPDESLDALLLRRVRDVDV